MLQVGEQVSARKLTTIVGAEIALPAPNETVHLQFRRFAGCPICSLHLRDVAHRHQEITDAGITEVVVFHSTADALRRYQADLPFAVVADPNRALYNEFGVESSIRSVLFPRAWLAAGRGFLRTRSVSGAAGIRENHFGMPADFLIGPDGTVRARKYGAHADDQWSVDELLRLATT